MSFEVRAIRENELSACLDLWHTVWSNGGTGYFERYFYGDVEWLPYYTQVGVLDGKLVSAVQICKRTVACGDFRLTMGGIANVATLPEHRGKGYNTECLKSAIKVMEADAMDFSLLFTGINDYYRRLGYTEVSRARLSGKIRPDFVPKSVGYTFRKVRPDDLPAIRRIYDAYNRNRPIAVQRYEAYWRDWIQVTETKLPEMLYVVEQAEGEVCGYANCGTFRSAIPYSTEEAFVSINEFGVHADNSLTEEAMSRALLEGLATHFLAEGAIEMRLEIPLTASVHVALDDILIESKGGASSSGMVRLLHPENLPKSFAMLWNDRWISAGRPKGVMQFETPYGSFGIDATGSLLKVTTSELEAEPLSQGAFFGLLFGTLLPQEVTSQSESYPLLSTLFPPQAAIYWGADGF